MSLIAAAQSIEFVYPQWLWLLAVLPILTILLHRYMGAVHNLLADLFANNVHTESRYLHPLTALLHSQLESRSIHHRGWLHSLSSLLRAWWRWLILACFVLALANPVRIGAPLASPPPQRDIILIVDTSISMMLKDYVVEGKRISRMLLLKDVLQRFIERLQGDRISIVVYADAAYTLVPLTHDRELLTKMLNRIRTGIAGRTNAMGDAIGLAIKHARDQRPSTAQRRRVLVLFSDGARPTGAIAPETAAELAREAGLHLYSIAVGADTQEASEQKATGLLYDPADLHRLASIAEHTGGKFYRAGDAAALRQAVDDIVKTEVNPTPTAQRFKKDSLYLWPLLLGLGILTFTHFSQARRLKAA